MLRRQVLRPCFRVLHLYQLHSNSVDLSSLSPSCCCCCYASSRPSGLASSNAWPLRHFSNLYTPDRALDRSREVADDRQVWADSGSQFVIKEHFRQTSSAASAAASGASSGQGDNGLLSRIRLPDRLRQSAAETFLPRGYPDSVGRNYTAFTSWMGAYYATGALNGVLSSTFMLYAVGLSSGAVPTAGALSWVLKDGAGQICTLLVGRLISHKFDIHPKQWYVIAAIQSGVASLLELCTFAVPGPLFLPLAACANALRGLSWMATSGTRSAFIATFAKSANIADVAAKATAQAVAASALGTATGAMLAVIVRQDVYYGAMLMGLGVGAQIFAASKAARCVPLNTLSMDRLYAAAQSFVSSDCQTVLHPASVANKESSPLLTPPCPVIYIHRVAELKRLADVSVVINSLREFSDENFALIPLAPTKTAWQSRLFPRSACPSIAIVMRPSVPNKTIVRAVLAAALRMEEKILDSKQASLKAREMEEHFEKMAKVNGWDVSHLLIDGLEHRLEWKLK